MTKRGGRPPGPPRTLGLTRDLAAVAVVVVAASTVISPWTGLRAGAPLLAVLSLPLLRTYRVSAVDIAAILLAALYWSSALWSKYPDLTGAVAADQIYVTILFLALRVLLQTRRLVKAAILGLGIGCAYAVYQLFLENPGTTLAFDYYGAQSASAAGLNPNYLAYAMATGLGAATLLGRRRSGLVVFVAAVPVVYAGVVLTGSRGAAVSAAAVLAWVLTPKRFRGIGLKAVTVVTVAAAVLIFTGWADDLVQSRVRPVTDVETGTLNGRLLVWPEAREAFGDRWWIGHGAGALRDIAGIYAHNAPLDVATSVGAGGLLLYLAILWWAIVAETKGIDRTYRLFVIGAFLTALAPPLLTGYWYQSPVTWVALAIFSKAAHIAPRGEALLEPVMVHPLADCHAPLRT